MTERTGTETAWKDYRKTTGKLTWRLAVPDDLPAIRRLRNVTERFLQQPQRNPQLFGLPVLLTLVAVNERGTIVDLVYIEAQVEVVKMACTAVGFEESMALDEDLSKWLRECGFRTALVTTNQRMKPKMSEGLAAAGFKCMDAVLSYWKRRL
jgi:hypothetical protein